MELYLTRDEQPAGPYTPAEVQAMVAANEVARTCPAWREGMVEWQPLENVVALPASPTQPQLPAGLPPIPSRFLVQEEGGSWSQRLEAHLQRLAKTRIGSVIKYKVAPFAGSFILVLILLSKCHHHR